MRLPVVPVPLLEGDADVEIDLQAAFDAVYDDLGYDLSVDYAEAPEIPLSPGAAAWAEAWLREVAPGQVPRRQLCQTIAIGLKSRQSFNMLDIRMTVTGVLRNSDDEPMPDCSCYAKMT